MRVLRNTVFMAFLIFCKIADLSSHQR